MQELTLRQNVAIKEVTSSGNNVLIIKGIASLYRTPEGFIQPDRDDELVNLDFMDLESYRKNPVLCMAHQWDRVIGKVLSLEHKDGALHITAEVHRLTGEEAVFEAVEKGLLKSLSIGFIPKQFIYRDDFNGEILEIAKSVLVEISLMPVQSNPDALFEVVQAKGVNSLTISKKEVAKQNHMTCNELDGSCAYKQLFQSEDGQEKEVTMATKAPNTEKTETQEKPAEEVKPEVKESPETKEETPEVKDKGGSKEPEKNEEPTTPAVLDEAALVAAVDLIQTKKEELQRKKEEEEKRKADEEAKQKEQDRLAKITAAKEFIETRKQEILDTSAEDFDIEEVDEFYNLVASATEAIEDKVSSIISETLKSKE